MFMVRLQHLEKVDGQVCKLGREDFELLFDRIFTYVDWRLLRAAGMTQKKIDSDFFPRSATIGTLCR